MTLLELLVVIAMITVLLGLLMPVMSGVKEAGQRTSEMSAARQLMMAYTNYANLNRDAVMPGYKLGLPAFDARGRSVAELTLPAVGARYPWRLAPFLDYNMRGMYTNAQERHLEAMENIDEWHTLYFTSLAPSLGLNATWVGGHERRYGFNPLMEDTFGRFYVTRLSEVIHPDRLMVFGSARGLDPLDLLEGNGVSEGYFEIVSPRLSPLEGDVYSEVFSAADDPADFGFVSPRYSGEAIAAFIDCHAEPLSEAKLRDMRHWANRANSPDYTLELRR